MTGPDELVTRGGQVLSARVWELIADAGREVGVSPVVVQGGHKGTGGAGASAGTHAGGDVFDLRVKDIAPGLWVPLAVALRRRNVCAWVRSPAFGWTSTAPHLHGVVRDSAAPLAPAARGQVRDYDLGLNGLASRGPDPHPRPVQSPYVMDAGPPVPALPAVPPTIAPPAPTLIGDDEMAFTCTAPDNTTWLVAGVWRKPVTWDQANALAALAQPVPYQGRMPQLALDAYKPVA